MWQTEEEKAQEWLWMSRPKEFWDTMGHLTEEEAEKRYEEIPRYYKPLCQLIYELGKQFPDNDCFTFRQLLYMASEDIEREGIDLHLPSYWYMDGVMIEPELIVKATNGIVGFRCDESREKCGLTKECRFYDGVPLR